MTTKRTKEATRRTFRISNACLVFYHEDNNRMPWRGNLLERGNNTSFADATKREEDPDNLCHVSLFMQMNGESSRILLLLHPESSVFFSHLILRRRLQDGLCLSGNLLPFISEHSFPVSSSCIFFFETRFMSFPQKSETGSKCSRMWCTASESSLWEDRRSSTKKYIRRETLKTWGCILERTSKGSLLLEYINYFQS